MSRLLAWCRVAMLDLRGSSGRFAILIACLALGVAAIGIVSSVGATLRDAIQSDARLILGGDLEVRSQQSDVDASVAQALSLLGKVSREVELSARAISGDDSAFLSLRAVGPDYPLVGTVRLADGQPPHPIWDRLRSVDGVAGVILAPQAAQRLGVALGDTVRIGTLDFELRGIIASLPDQAAQGFQLGAPAIIADTVLSQSGLTQEGVLSRYRYKLDLGGASFDAAEAALEARFPGHDWQIRSPRDATAGIARFFRIFGNFLLLVGLSSLFVGGLGIANAVTAYLGERQASIATMRSLGASGQRLVVHFMLQILVLSLSGIGIGSAIVIASTLVGLPLLGDFVGLHLGASLRVDTLLLSGCIGIVTSALFAWVPLRKVSTVRPALLFRNASVGGTSDIDWVEMSHPRAWLPFAGGLLTLFALTAGLTGDPLLVTVFLLGMIAALLVLRIAAALLKRLLTVLPRSRRRILRLAISSVHRPGAPTTTVVVSLGMGLSLLLIVILTQANIGRQIANAVLDQAPAFVLLDVDPATKSKLDDFSTREANITDFEAVPMLRGTITAINGNVAPEPDDVPAEVADMFRGDTPLSWERELPAGTEILSGTWWPDDYAGPPLLSLSTEMEESLGLRLGETMELTVFGRPLTATISSFRRIDWRSPRFNFRMILSPGLIEGAPQSYMGGIKVAPGADAAVEAQLVASFPSLTFIPVGEAVRRAQSVVDALGQAVALVGSVAVLAGVLVLAGALSVGRRQRDSDAVVMKVLGATRGEVIGVFVIEYLILGLLAAALALAVGILGAWATSTLLLDLDFDVDFGLIAATVVGVSALTIATGGIVTWSSMSSRPATRLRSEST